MHAYWVYRKSLEINVWNTFKRRTQAILRGKKYSNENIGSASKPTTDFNRLVDTSSSCLVLNNDSAKLPIPNNFVDAIITDPPYGGNVNYAELSDFWYVWMSGGRTSAKAGEVIINRTQSKKLAEYELLLKGVLRECYRVLKPGRYMVSTFNSRDVRVVRGFITAATRAGFTLDQHGVSYQKPIRPYATTFHAMQIGAFVGDFIFPFAKEKSRPSSTNVPQGLADLKDELEEIVRKAVIGKITEPELREKAYMLLIPFLAENARAEPDACDEAVDYFEKAVRDCEEDLRGVRMNLIRERKRKFRLRPSNRTASLTA